MQIMEISKMENEYERFLNIYKSTKREIILYGAGSGADWATGLLQKLKWILKEPKSML